MLLLWKKDSKRQKPIDPNFSKTLSTLIQETDSNKEIPKEQIHEMESLVKKKKWSFPGKWLLETIITLSIALVLAILIRQMWFELYEIPTGSMRPTFKEQDRVLVSKTAFGLNMPLFTSHLSFSEKRLKQGSIVVLTTDKLDMPDIDTTYFGIFPAKKRYVKRLVGMPEQYLYFYGGDIYILKSDGKTIERIHSIPELQPIEYIPFISFEGKIEPTNTSRFSRTKTFRLSHFNSPIAEIEISPYQKVQGRIFAGGHWVEEFKDQDTLFKTKPHSFGEFWGINNFAKCRLLLPSDLPREAQKGGYSYPQAALYLELHHNPYLPNGAILAQNATWPLVRTRVSWIPLLEGHVEKLAKALTTARFVIADGKVHRYHFEKTTSDPIPLPNPIPDGTYEFIQGIAYKIGFQGYAEQLPPTHPLYPSSIEALIFWYNVGIEMQKEFLQPQYPLIPSRFAYFNDGSLYALGKPLFEADEPLLAWFLLQEVTRQANDPSYQVFQDHGSFEKNPPDPQFMKTYGLHIKKGQYLVLGDNHAMSYDGRFFGPIPRANIQGSPLFILSPFGSRWGLIEQTTSSFPSFWSFVMWSITLASIIGYKVHIKRKRQRLIQEFKTAFPFEQMK
jgi:signal peptidase I